MFWGRALPPKSRFRPQQLRVLLKLLTSTTIGSCLFFCLRQCPLMFVDVNIYTCQCSLVLVKVFSIKSDRNLNFRKCWWFIHMSRSFSTLNSCWISALKGQCLNYFRVLWWGSLWGWKAKNIFSRTFKSKSETWYSTIWVKLNRLRVNTADYVHKYRYINQYT